MEKELIEQVVGEVVLEWHSENHPRGKDGKFQAKGRAELKYAHANFAMRNLADKAGKIQNGNTKKSAMASLKKLQPHLDAMVNGIHHPVVDNENRPDYSSVHQAHSQLMDGIKEYNRAFKE